MTPATRKYNDIGSAWLGALNWEEAEAALDRLPVIIPLGGSGVDHGPHLPYDTDRVIAEAIVEAVAEQTPVLVAPTIDYVYAPEVAGQGGTISLRPESFIRLVSDIIRSLARHGGQRFIIVDRGTGTLAPLNIVSREMHGELGVSVAIANPSGLAWEQRKALFESPEDGHAGAVETSLMLALNPERVRLESSAAGDPDSPYNTESVFLPRRIEHPVGPDGDTATPEKGHQTFIAMVNEISAWIDDSQIDTQVTVPSQRFPAPAFPASRLTNQLYSSDWSSAVQDFKVAVLPLGAASKEHGYHLPNQTDYLEAEAFKNAVAGQMPLLVLPTFGFGYYPAFVNWPGSLHLSPRTYQMVISDIIGCLANAGVSKIFLLDTGLSTQPVLEIVARETMAAYGVAVALAGETGAAAGRELFLPDGGTHANDAETSLMLAIAPEQVDMSRAVRDLRPSTILSRRDPAAPVAFVQGGSMQSDSGVFGDATVASREKGEEYLAAKVADLVAFLEWFIEDPSP